ncbi:hypothetical protein KIW84_058257 [Lathyrus oleraceus]|uniref:DUF7745 domain-containing protein n=1 Tax=Pisum sativum TaxID=3888 RepID=A0A9D4X6U2_PEA|nr:hypothetical protein KIW84_058257 [Pisum sativum]
MAPTLEKFGKILEISKSMKGPLKMTGYHPTVEEVAYHLCIHEADMQANLRVCGDFKGFLREYLEKRVDEFATSLQWDAMDNIMILLTFGLILVPTEKDFVDYTTTNLFLAVKVGDEDLVPALLADVYYTLYQRHINSGALEQLKRSEERTILEEEKEEQAYVDLRVASSSLSAHKEELD